MRLMLFSPVMQAAKQRTNIILIALFFGMLVSACTLQQQPTYNNWKMYIGSYYKVSYPSDWNVVETENGTGFVPPQSDEFQENLYITLNQLREAITLEDYMIQALKDLQTLPGYVLLSSVETNIGNYPAKQVTYKTDKAQFRQTVFLVNKKVYILTYVAMPESFDTYANEMDAVSKTIEVITVEGNEALETSVAGSKSEDK